MPRKPLTIEEKIAQGIPLTAMEKTKLKLKKERNRLKKINIGNKYSKGAAGMTALDRKLLKEKKERLKKKKPKGAGKRKVPKDKETKKRKKKVSESRKAQRIGLTRKEKVKKHKESFKKYGMREKYTLPGQRNIFGPAGGGVTTRPEIQERDKRRKKAKKLRKKIIGY